jgi:hypothetical protein
MSVGRKTLDACDPQHCRWCFQCRTIAALCIWMKFWILFLIDHGKPSVKIPNEKKYRLAVMCAEDRWSESLLIHLVLKMAFVVAERWISDQYAGSIVIVCKAFNIRRSIHDGHPGGQRCIPTSRIRAGNDGSRISQYWMDIWSRDPQRLSGCIGARRDFYHEHIFEFSESLHEVTNCVRFIFLSYRASTMSCVQIVLENGNLQSIKTNALFKMPCPSNVSLVAFWKVPWSAKSPSRIMRKSLGVKAE